MTNKFLTARLTLETSALDNWTDMLENIEDTMSEAGRRTLELIEEPLLAKLQEQPGAVKTPIEWTPSKHPADIGKKPNTEWGYYSRQKAAFFATKGFDKGIPTGRSGDLVDGWVLDSSIQRNKYTIKIRNKKEYGKYVIGKIDFRSEKAALEPIQKFHTNTGWKPAIKVIKSYYALAIEEYNNQIRQMLDEAVKVKRRNR